MRARVERGLRRLPRRAPRGRARADQNVARARVRTRARRRVGVPQGGWRGEVLHARTARERSTLTRAETWLERAGTHCATNYDPLPLTLVRGCGAWLEDVHGTRYLDFLSAYSATSFGHGHPRLVAAAHRQLGKLTLTSRAFGTAHLEPFCDDLSDLC